MPLRIFRRIAYVIFCAVLVVTLVVTSVWFYRYRWRRCILDLPNDWGTLAVAVRPGHIVLNELDYCLQYRRNGDRAWEQALPPAPLARGMASVVWYPAADDSGPFLYLAGGGWDCVVDFKVDEAFAVFYVDGVKYLAYIDSTGDAVRVIANREVATRPDGSIEVISEQRVITARGEAQRFDERIDVSRAQCLGRLEPANGQLVFTPTTNGPR